MNKHLHRIIFNAARGVRMVVQETATSTGKGASKGTSKGTPKATGKATTAASAALFGVLVALPGQAQIVSGPPVPGPLRPTVLVAPNGVPLVNIQTPSAAGVSRNVYQQFDVMRNGAILNNSRVNVQTQLGGFVQGNAWLARGPARVILNEINSGSPTQLRGYVEVGGQRAEVIIANPAGISVDGGGFINASRATLTTGVPQFNAMGGLDSFVVRGGTVSIEGAGLDFGKADYAAILARAVQVNAGIWASELKVVAGANQVWSDSGQVTPVAGTGAVPTYALDVAALGGMYAQKITLVGTEAGLGVRNAGSLGAGAGGLVVTAQGRLENTGTLEGQRVELASSGDIDNRGGTIRQTSMAALTIDSPVLSNTRGGVIGAEPAAPGDGASGVASAASAGNAPSSLATSTATASTGGTLPGSSSYAPLAPGAITAAGTIRNDGGRIYAGGPITLKTPQIDNAGGTLNVATMAVTGARFSNAGGTLNVSQSFGANVGQFDNTGGKLNAGSVNITASGDLLNVDGTLISGSDAHLVVGGRIDNTRGTLAAMGRLTAQVTKAVDNTAGTVSAGTDLYVKAQALNTSGAMRGVNDTTLVVDGALVNEGSITAGRHTAIDAGKVASGSASLLGAGVQNDGKLGAAGDLRVTSTGALVANGTNLAAGNAMLQGASVDLSGKQTSAANIAVTSTQGDVKTGKATIATPGTLSILANAQAGQTLVNEGGKLNADRLNLKVSNIANTKLGEIVQTGTAATTVAVSGTLNNDGGRIASNSQDLSLRAAAFGNAAGKIEHAGAGTLRIEGGSYSAAGGEITGNGALVVDMSSSFQQDGGRTNARQITIGAGSLSNRGGKIAGTSLSVDTRGGALDNGAKGTMTATGAVTLRSGALNNDAGLIQSDGALLIDTNRQTLANTNAADFRNQPQDLAGGIVSAGTLTLKTGALNNTAGAIGSKDALTADTLAFTNTGKGVVLGQATVNVKTNGAGYDNAGGQTLAASDLGLDAGGGTIGNNGGLIRSTATATLKAGSVVNTNTPSAEQGIEGKNVVVTGSVEVNNTGGRISAVETLSIKDPNAADPAARTLSIVNTNGVLMGGQPAALGADGKMNSGVGGVFLGAKSFSGDGQVISANDLGIALVQDVTHNGQVSVNGNLTYTTTGKFTNNAKLLAGQTLTVGGSSVDNTAGAEMSGRNTIVNAGATLTNRGLIDSAGATQINAGTLNNVGTGRIYGNAVSVAAGTLDNYAETVGGVTKAATIAARETLNIGADTVSNREHALIFSGGTGANAMKIGGRLDGNREATTSGSVLDNLSADIESLGGMTISMGQVNNRDIHIQKGAPTVTPGLAVGAAPATAVGNGVNKIYPLEQVRLDPATGSMYLLKPNGGGEELIGTGGYGVWTNILTTSEDTATHIDPAHLVAGGDMRVNGRLYNQDSQVLAGGTITATDYVAEQMTGQRTVKGIASVVNQRNEAGLTNVPLDAAPVTLNLGAYKYQPNINATNGYNAGSAATGAAGGAGGTGGVSGGPGTIVEVPAKTGSALATAGSAGGPGASQTVPMVVRTSMPNIRIPNASLFGLRAGGSGYLIETDPRFANYRAWLSSDYLLNRMGLDPNNTLKRLGDGFYEQKLIREQVAQLTGYRYLDGFSDDDAQYLELMNAGSTFAAQYGLRPGIALSAAQMAQLTSDIVWLVEQTVTLPDGSTQRVLVPQVYVRVRPGDIDGSGALLSADATVIKSSGDLVNTGTIAGRSLVSINAENVDNLGGRIAGGSIGINARNDLNNIGGSITARDAAVLTAGRDINIRTTTQSAGNTTGIDRVAGVYVTNPGGTLIASAGRDANIVGAALVSAGAAAVGAGRNINLGTVSEGYTIVGSGKGVAAIASERREVGSVIQGQDNVRLAAGNDLNIRAGAVASMDGALIATAGHDINVTAGQATSSVAGASRRSSSTPFKKSSSSTLDSSSTTDVLSSSLSGKSMALVAGNDINLQAAQLRSEDAMSLSAGRDINLTTANRTNQELHASQSKRSGTVFGQLTAATAFAGDPTAVASAGNKNASNRAEASITTTAIGTSISAGSLQTVSGRDTTLRAATVVADNDITMLAGRNLTIESAQNTSIESSYNSNSKSGMVGTWYNPAIGNIKGSQATTTTRTTQQASQVASLQGNVTLIAGNEYRQTASSIMAAGQAGSLVGGDVNILAKNVVINEAYNTTQSISVDKNSSTIVGGSASIGGISTDTLRGASSTIKAMGNTGDSRMQALGIVNLAMSGKQAYDTASALASGGGLSYGVSVNVSRNSSESTSLTNSSEAVGSSVVGANNVNIVATGGDKASNIRAIGSTIAAGNTVNLAADNDITLEASRTSVVTTGKNSSNGANVGVTFGAGAQNGFSIQLGVSNGKGHSDQNDLSYNATQVSGGKAVNISSGGDLTLRGATVEANRVTADVGGNLSIESLQDVSVGESRQSSSGLNLSLCIPPICYGAVATVGASAAGAKADGVFISPAVQSSIKAGDGGFDVKVAGNTDLKGAVIESTQAAIDGGKNSFDTGGALTMSDLQNVSQSSGSSYSVSGSVSVGYTTAPKAATETAPAKEMTAAWSGPNSRPGGSAGVGSFSGNNQSSVTKSGISGIAGDQSVRTGDNSSTGTLIKDWNTQDIVKNVQAQAQITQQFNQNAAREIGTYANKKYDELKNSDPVEAAKWAEGGEYRAAAHAAAGALSGGVAGALGAGASAALMPRIGDAIDEMGLAVPVAQALGAATSAAVGGMFGGVAGAATAYGVDINNRQSTPAEKRRVTTLQEGKTVDQRQRLEDAACALTRCAYGIDPNDLRYSAAVSSQNRGTQYLDEQRDLKATGLFNYDAWNAASDSVAVASYGIRNELKSAGRGAANVAANIADDFALSVSSFNPQLPPDDIGGKGPTAGGGGAVVTPMPICTPAGCVIAPVIVGSPGHFPSNWTFSSENQDDGKKGTNNPANTANYGPYKKQIELENLKNIAASDPRLAATINGSGKANPNYNIGSGSVAEADQLGKTWVGDGAKRLSDSSGWMSADGTRIYRSPTQKSSSFATTGVQANFETYAINPITGQRVKTGNGHLNVK
ncbi:MULTISPECIES: hemagglutinin repeat-containing protein [unclassified Variovorax]|uniref:hemagglutinin repeat-containing protein n=1 Tax=unclassified Variovorax TaxID=663243 RepID=UPI003F485FE1